MSGAAGDHPGVQVPGCGALHRGGDTLPDTLHSHFTLLPSCPLFCVYAGARVSGAAGEHPRVQVPGCGALHRGGDTLPDTLHRHFTFPLPPSQPLFYVCAGA